MQNDVRLIDANALEFVLDPYNVMNGVGFAGRCGGKTAAMVGTALKHMIDNAPTIDAVPVVRCKDCKYRHCSEYCECRPDDAFCSDGEKMDGGSP